LATVRKRTWVNKSGVTQQAWNVDYKDSQGNRRFETFKLKKQADARLTVIQAELAKGIHTPTSASKTVREAAEIWYKRGLAKNEAATMRNYRHLLDAYILPELGRHKLSSLTKPGVFLFRDHLVEKGASAVTANKVLHALKGVLKTAEEYGMVSQNVASGVTVATSNRDQRRLEVGIDVPTKAELKAMIDASTGRWRPLIITLCFAALRASEIRGLLWNAVDLDGRVIHIRERADRFNQAGPPKSKAGRRDIPLSPMLVNTLREWRLKLRSSKSGLVFPSQADTPLWHSGIVNDWFRPLQRRLGIVDGDGQPKYPLHSLRHFCASHWIELGFQPKQIQTMLGHSSIVMTYDRYGHWMPNPEADQERLAKGDLFVTG
jgi:integrase